MNKLHQDIIMAQKLVSGSKSNINGTAFHNTSVIYKGTNEKQIDYQHHILGKKDILTTLGSSDQVLNSMLVSPNSITAFDISRFPKYFLYLKLAAVLNLSYEEFIYFFFESTTTSEIYDDMYDKISNSLPKDDKEFWDSLFSYFDWYDIYESSMFSRETVIPSYHIRQNPYLTKENYYCLRELIPAISLKTKEGNIYTMDFDQDYDFINLSNIWNYNNPHHHKELLRRLPLRVGGEAISYSYDLSDKVKDFFQDENITFEQFPDSKAGIFVYTKKR